MSSAILSTGHTQEEMRSIEQFLGSCTVPLVYQSNGRTFVHGTGTFFQLGQYRYLVTAAHIFKDIDPKDLAVPEGPTNTHIWTLGNITIHHPKEQDEFDVAVVRLEDEDFCSRIAKGWRFLGESNVAPDSLVSTDYIVAGYPTATVEHKPGCLVPQALMQLYTGPYEGPVDGNRASLDVLLRYSKTAKGVFGDMKPTPDLGGVSGASIWAVAATPDGLWAPDTMLKIVGVQVSFKHSSYVRGKSWALVSEIIRRIATDNETLSEAVSK